jgi:hypothetical protein
MQGYFWMEPKLSGMVRPFQQRKLKEELTSVAFTPICVGHEPYWTAESINEAIRKQLLQHHPQRLSKRLHGE